MKHPDITIVTCCADFDDYLRLVIMSWKKLQCKKIIVVTPSDDIKTIRFCKDNGLTALKVKRIDFIRGYYLNAGLREVKTKWTLILDSDCYVTLSEQINTNVLNTEDMHGLPHMTISLKDLERYKQTKKLPPRKKIYGLCMGFFQLFNTQERINRDKWFSEEWNVHEGGKGADWYFAKRWGKSRLSDEVLICISNRTNREGRVSHRILSTPVNKSESHEQLLEDKLKNIKEFTEYDRGIRIYEK